MIREHNKTVASGIYSELVNRLKLTPQQAAEFNNLLADHAMENIDLVVRALGEGKSSMEMRQVFAASDAAFENNIRSSLGDAALREYQNYAKNLGSTILVNSFAGSLAGGAAAVADKKSRLLQVMQKETESVLASAGLPANYQTLVAANPGSFVSKDEAAYNLQLKDDILARTAESAAAFLSPKELDQFQAMRTNAIKNTWNYISMERAILAPGSQ